MIDKIVQLVMDVQNQENTTIPLLEKQLREVNKKLGMRSLDFLFINGSNLTLTAIHADSGWQGYAEMQRKVCIFRRRMRRCALK